MSVACVSKLNPGNLFRWSPRQTCAADDCWEKGSFFRRILDRTATVKFRGSQFCFPACFERELLRRLKALSLPAAPSRSRPRRIPLGLLMLSRGVLSKEQLLRALDEQKRAGSRRVGELLREMGFVADRDIAAALAVQWSCPLMRRLPLHGDAFGIPTPLLQRYCMVPVYLSGPTGTLHIAFADEIAYPALVSIEQMLQVKTEACLTTECELNAALVRMEENSAIREKLFENLSGPEEVARIISGYAGKLRAAEVRITACGEYFWARALGAAAPFDLIFSCRRIHPAQSAEGV